jgi:predicted choloylglycine hydrolase
LLKTAWLGRDVIGMVEGMAGLSDGMNAAGLAISLSFGGRAAKGRGFGIPLILRYVLEICTDVADAVEVLRAVPCHMAYNVTVVDHEGNHATVMLSPDRPPIVTDARATTNHQIGNEWPKYARHTRTLEREKHLQRALAAPYLDRAGFERLFLTAPLHSQRYGEGFGTVYTAVYRPAEGTMRLAWPGLASMDQSFSGFTETARTLAFTDGAPPTEASDDVAGNDRLWDVFHQRNEDHDLGSWHNLNSTALVQEQETSK